MSGEVITRPPSLYAADGAYDLLIRPPEVDILPSEMSFEESAAYEHYLKMHKVILGNKGADELEDIYVRLADEDYPRYLTAAGWAAAEAAIIGGTRTLSERLELLDHAVVCWSRALNNQKILNALCSPTDIVLGYPIVEDGFQHRIALDLAIAPLVRGMITGNLAQDVKTTVFKDCLRIAQSNAVQVSIMAKEQCQEGLSGHVGFAHECNALLAFNRNMFDDWFVIPSMARSDTGIHHAQQTHDLLVVHLHGDQVTMMTPLEIKAKAGAKERARYKALLVRSKLHLSVPGKYKPEIILSAIEAVFEGTATPDEQEIADHATSQLIGMIRDYCAGERLAELATRRGLTAFHDKSLVLAHYPGLASRAI